MSIGSWFKTHRRQVIAHTSIVVGFVFLTIFIIEPLFFDRLDRIPDEAQLHTISLPDVTRDITHTFHEISVVPGAIWMNGWAFIWGYNTKDIQIYIVLKSDSTTYIFDTASRNWPHVTRTYKELNLNLDKCGFITTIPSRKIKDGLYAVGIYIKKKFTKGDIESLKYTSEVVIKSKDTVVSTSFASKLQQIILPEESGNIRCVISFIREQKDEENEFVKIYGWAFIKGLSAKSNKTYLALKSDINTYIFDTIPNYTWWVPDQLGITNLGLDWAGFIARVPKEEIENGTYEIGIYVKNGDIEALQYTGRVVEF